VTLVAEVVLVLLFFVLYVDSSISTQTCSNSNII